jgi:hypothetical protein
MHQTDEPIDPADAVLKSAEPDAEDTEGHSLYAGEFHQSLARERSREVDKYAADQALRKDLPKGHRRSLRQRLTGR